MENILDTNMLGSESGSIWNSCISESPSATVFHRWEWLETIRQTYGYRSFRLGLERSGRTVGVFAFSLLDGALGNRLVSSPFSDYGGPCFTGVEKSDDIGKTCSAIDAFANKSGCRYSLLKSLPESLCPYFEANGYVLLPDLCTFEIDLSVGRNQIEERFARRRRRSLRKASENGLSLHDPHVELELGQFYEIYLSAMHRLGSPPHKVEFFANLFGNFLPGRGLKTITCSRDGRILGSVLLLINRDRVHYYSCVWGREGIELEVPTFLTYHAIMWAAESGFLAFDFGRTSKGSGVFEFKSSFGAKPSNLNVSVKRYGTFPILSPEDWRYRALSRTLKSTPRPLFKKIGPHLKSRLE